MEDQERAKVTQLHAHLAATAQRPVETRASRWLGEAEAAAADAAGEDVPPGAVAKRVSQVRDLLSNVERTGDPEADEHLQAARELARELDRRF